MRSLLRLLLIAPLGFLLGLILAQVGPRPSGVAKPLTLVQGLGLGAGSSGPLASNPLMAVQAMVGERWGPRALPSPPAVRPALTGSRNSLTDLLPAPMLAHGPEPRCRPMELFSRLEAARVLQEGAELQVLFAFERPVHARIEGVTTSSVDVLVYPVDRMSLEAALGALSDPGVTVSHRAVSRFVHRLDVRAPPGWRFESEPAVDESGPSESAVPRTEVQSRLVVAFRPEESGDDSVAPARRARLKERARRQLRPGLVYSSMSYWSERGLHSDVHIIELDTAVAEIDVVLGTGEPVMRTRTRLTEMARREKAVAALNASYFAQSGAPLGLLMVKGRLLSAPVYNRSSFAMYQGRKFLWGNPEFSGKLVTSRGAFSVVRINESGHDGKVAVYTPDFGRSTRTAVDGLEIAVAGDHVVAIGEKNLPIPADGFVVACHGGHPDGIDELDVDDSVAFEYGVTPPWNLCDLAIGGGPRLVKDGQPQVNSAQEHFAAAFAKERAPRSAVGVRDNGTLVLVAVDGRHPPDRCGVTLAEAARIMTQLGCRQAMNLDGGGSSAMVVEGDLVNSPSDGREREVSTGILLVDRHAGR